MHKRGANPAYMKTIFELRVFTYVRRLLLDSEPHIQFQARRVLEFLADIAWEAYWLVERRDQFVSYFVIKAEPLADHTWCHRCFRTCIAICRQTLNANATDERVTGLLLHSYAEIRMWPRFERVFQRNVCATGLHL